MNIDSPDYFEDETPVRALRSGGFGSVARNRLLDLVEDGRSELVRSFDGLVLAAHELAAKVDGPGGNIVGDYVRQAAGLVEHLQGSLRDRPVEDLIDSGRDMVRRSPALSVGIALAAGFVAARLVKAAGRDSDGSDSAGSGRA